jgi:hypothetical protein
MRIRTSIVQRLMRTAEHPRFETPKGWSVMVRCGCDPMLLVMTAGIQPRAALHSHTPCRLTLAWLAVDAGTTPVSWGKVSRQHT